jgi:glutamate/tyrosine decarboxylase-like PLP-dependent enzyme
MDVEKLSSGPLSRVPSTVADPLFRLLGRIPPVRRMLEAEFDRTLEAVGGTAPGPLSFASLPDQGVDVEALLPAVQEAAEEEKEAWRDGFASGAVYHGADDHIDLLNRVYALHSQANPLHVDLWPSAVRFEAEIVSMTAHLLGGSKTTDEVVGTVTSGGSESIILAMKAYRDRAGRDGSEIVAPTSAHVAFDKAAHLLGMRLVKVPVGPDQRADVEAMEAAITRRTAVMVGSAPGFPHGVIDPIEELSEIARERWIGFHTDACLGGFVLPFAADLGHPVPPFDFSLPGVTSMSADPHKYGYTPKGTSVVLYRGRELRRHQYFTATEWPGGLYYSPTIPGSRPGGLSAAAWTAMVSIGKSGYRAATERILAAAARIRGGIEEIEGLEVMGDPMWVIAFRSSTVDIYQVLEQMVERGWSLNGLHHPPAIHIAVTLRHTAEGVVDRFITDLRAAVDQAGAPVAGGGSVAPVYGMAATFPARGLVEEMLERYIDRLYDL